MAGGEGVAGPLKAGKGRGLRYHASTLSGWPASKMGGGHCCPPSSLGPPPPHFAPARRPGGRLHSWTLHPPPLVTAVQALP